jgi:hypothetical protein
MKIKYFIKLIIPVLLYSSALQADLPPEYSAVYTLNKFGMHAAEASSSLQKKQDGSWLYRSETETKGLISVFRKDRIIEQAVLQEHSGTIRPVNYQYIHKGSKKNRDRSITFDWDKLVASSTVSGHPSTLEIKPETVDNFSLQLKLMDDLKTDKRPLIYHVIKKGKADDYEFEILGNEIIETDAGDYRAIKLKRSREDSKRATIMWAAPELHFLPVKIQHIEPDGSQFSLLLKSVSGNILKPIAPPAGQTANSN